MNSRRYPDHKIGFSKFAKLRPKHWILGVCVHNTSECEVNVIGQGDADT